MKRKVLIVEDEALIARALKIRVESMGSTEVDTVSSVGEALEIATKNTPDLILMDIMMKGDQDGIDAAVSIWNAHQIPIIFLTGNPLFRTDERLKTLKRYWFFIKPVPDYYLQEAIHEALGIEGNKL